MSYGITEQFLLNLLWHWQMQMPKIIVLFRLSTNTDATDANYLARCWQQTARPSIASSTPSAKTTAKAAPRVSVRPDASR